MLRVLLHIFIVFPNKSALVYLLFVIESLQLHILLDGRGKDDLLQIKYLLNSRVVVCFLLAFVQR